MIDLVADGPMPLLPNRRLAGGTAASFAIHGLLIASLFLLTPLRHLVVPPPAPVSVEIVTEAQFEAIETPALAPARIPAITAPAGQGDAAPPTSSQAPVPSAAPLSTIPGVHVATEFYAGSILREPGMARIRKTMDTIAPSERLVQLCNIEGIEQIKRGAPDYAPDTIVPYAMSDTLTAGLTLSAPGAAFRSRRRWYGVSFSCTVAADLASVTAFKFTLGKPIPESDWEAHDLNAEDSDE
jgi:hypothetical protein